jgi:hypothetical protein
MGQWSEYFEDFPEENPANYDEHGVYDPTRSLRRERAKQDLGHRRLDEVSRSKPRPRNGGDS